MFATATASVPEEITIPRAREAVWVERLLWVFMLSFAFDYRAGEARQGGAGAGLDQMIFLLGPNVNRRRSLPNAVVGLTSMATIVRPSRPKAGRSAVEKLTPGCERDWAREECQGRRTAPRSQIQAISWELSVF